MMGGVGTNTNSACGSSKNEVFGPRRTETRNKSNETSYGLLTREDGDQEVNSITNVP